jgi:hypothetical protein
MKRDASYERQSALDNAFLVLEGPHAPMHLAATQIFDAAPPYGGIDFDSIVRAHAAVLHRVPRYRQKLLRVPLEPLPVWVDAARFDLRLHLRHTSLPRPGTDEQIRQLSAQLFEQHLDRSRQLRWTF